MYQTPPTYAHSDLQNSIVQTWLQIIICPFFVRVGGSQCCSSAFETYCFLKALSSTSQTLMTLSNASYNKMTGLESYRNGASASLENHLGLKAHKGLFLAALAHRKERCTKVCRSETGFIWYGIPHVTMNFPNQLIIFWLITYALAKNLYGLYLAV